jgi:hypothetical protein
MTAHTDTHYSVRDTLRATVYLCILFVLCACNGVAQEKRGALDLIRLAKSGSPELARSITQAFNETQLHEGTAAMGHLSSFFFALEAASKPTLMIDGAPGPELQLVPNTVLWYAIAEISKQGAIHSFFYLVQGKRFGGSTDLPVFDSFAYLEPGVYSGTLSQPLLHTSKIYDGMQTTYWTYVPAQYNLFPRNTIPKFPPR